MKETLKDWLFNSWLQLKNGYIRAFIREVFIREERSIDLEKMYLDHVCYLVQKDFESGEWIKNLWWGSYAKDEKVSWMDRFAVMPSSRSSIRGDNLRLITAFNPKRNEHNGFIMAWARGSVQRKEAIRDFGFFEVTASIPKAEGIWHAPLWFVAAGEGETINVLPEIDVAEVYYKNGKAQVKTNIHFGEDYEENARNIGSRTHFVPDFWNRFVSYGLLWLPDRLEFYYDGWLVRRITDRRILDRLKDGLIPIINVSVEHGKPHDGSEMYVESFKYWR